MTLCGTSSKLLYDLVKALNKKNSQKYFTNATTTKVLIDWSFHRRSISPKKDFPVYFYEISYISAATWCQKSLNFYKASSPTNIFRKNYFHKTVRSLRPATLLKKRCFPVNFAKIPRTPFLTQHHPWLLLNYFHKVFKVYAYIRRNLGWR